MMVRPFLAVAPLFLLLLAGCTASPVPVENAELPARYDSPIVLFIRPDEQKLEQLRREYGEDFYTMADDAMWYRSQAYELLEEAGIPYAHPEADEGWFEVDGTPTRFSWREVQKAWFVIFYDGRHEPRILHDIELPFALEELKTGFPP